MSDLQKRNLVLLGDEAHHLNATTTKKSKDGIFTDSDDIALVGELSDSAKEEDI